MSARTMPDAREVFGRIDRRLAALERASARAGTIIVSNDSAVDARLLALEQVRHDAVNVNDLGVYGDDTAGGHAAALNQLMADQAASKGRVALYWPPASGRYIMESPGLQPPNGVPVIFLGPSSQAVSISREPLADYPVLAGHGTFDEPFKPLFDGVGFAESKGGAGTATLVELWRLVDGIIGDIRVEGSYASWGLHMREWFNCWAEAIRVYFTGGLLWDGTGPNRGMNGVQIGLLYMLDNKGPWKITGDATNADGSVATNCLVSNFLAEEGTGLNGTTEPVLDLDYPQDIDIARFLIQLGNNRSGMVAPIRMAGKSAGGRPVRLAGVVDYVQTLTTPPQYDVDHGAGTLDLDLISTGVEQPSVASVHIGQYVDLDGHKLRRRPNPNTTVVQDDRAPAAGAGTGGRRKELGKGYVSLLPAMRLDGATVTAGANSVVYELADGVTQAIETNVVMPDDVLPHGCAVKFRILWTANTWNAGDVVFSVKSHDSYWDGATGETNAGQTTYAVTEAWQAWLMQAMTTEIPGPTVRPNELLHVRLERVGGDSLDTLAFPARVLAVEVEYDRDF